MPGLAPPERRAARWAQFGGKGQRFPDGKGRSRFGPGWPAEDDARDGGSRWSRAGAGAVLPAGGWWVGVCGVFKRLDHVGWGGLPDLGVHRQGPRGSPLGLKYLLRKKLYCKSLYYKLLTPTQNDPPKCLLQAPGVGCVPPRLKISLLVGSGWEGGWGRPLVGSGCVVCWGDLWPQNPNSTRRWSNEVNFKVRDPDEGLPDFRPVPRIIFLGGFLILQPQGVQGHSVSKLV